MYSLLNCPLYFFSFYIQTRLKGLQYMSADRGNKNFTMWHYLFSYARYSNKDQRLSLLGALILPLEAIPQAVGAIPLRLGVFLGVLGCQGLFPWHLELLPWCWGLTPWVLGATSRALGAIPRALEANPRIQNFEQSSPRKMPQNKLLAVFTIGQMKKDTE